MIFQGAVRFGDAAPTVDGQRAWLTPRSWHVRKRHGDRSIFNLVAAGFPGDSQPEAVPPGWRTAGGEQVVVERHYSLRTSVAPDGRARSGLLYGLQVIPAGSRFRARLSGAEFLTVAAGKVTGIDDYYKYPADTRPRELSAAGEPDEVERSLRNLDRHWYRVDRADRDRVRP